MAKDFIVPIEMQSIDASTIGAGAYLAVGDPLEGALSSIRITNASNTPVIISFDGITDHIYIRATDSYNEYFQIGSTPNNNVAKLKRYTTVYIRGTAGVGLVYVSGYYNE